MADFSALEEQLLESVGDDRLRSSLAQLRQAAEDIWAVDSPRIIRDYTDHGIRHSERLADYAFRILNSTPVSLSSDEMYLLLGGIYLHDIGMQCDVVRWPQIKETAESYGASFDIPFDAASNHYSTEQQIAIRKNHHYLSIAWIDFAKKQKLTALGTAAQTIPPAMVRDLMDVCLHHTKLPISECPLSFRSGAEGRKQLVAAILRMADELDIASTRVNIEAVKTFAIDPKNSVYWYLHGSTKIAFPTPSAIKITVSLHPDDFGHYSALVREQVIGEFQNKNARLLATLRQNAINLTIDADSGVVSDEYAEKFPLEIRRALDQLRRPEKKNPALLEDLTVWLQALQYEVSPPERIDERSTQFEALLDQGSIKRHRVRVRCISDEITPEDIVAMDETLDKRVPQAWLISTSRISASASDKAEEYKDYISVYKFADFLSEVVWFPYISQLTNLVKSEQMPPGRDLYVDIGCFKVEYADDSEEKRRDTYESLDGYIDAWLREQGKKHISLLGEFGTGKTWFCRHYAFRQLNRFLGNPSHERFPLLITLRAFAKAMTAEQLVNDALQVQYQLHFVGTPFDVLKELNRNGKLLLILDGFDEMARQVDKQTMIDNFWELAKLVDENSKVILTSRTEYFRQSQESESILAGSEAGRKTFEINSPHFEVVYLSRLTDDQIRRIIVGRLEPTHGAVVANETADRILSTPNLAEMARKPVLVELLLAALDEANPDILQKPAQVYLYATNKLLLRNIETERTFTKTADKIFFLCELAWEMIAGEELRIHFKDLPKKIQDYFGDRIKDQHELDHWESDLRNQTLLHRNSGYFEFAHKSLAEFFVAMKIAAEIACLPRSFSAAYTEAHGKACAFPIKAKVKWEELERTFGLLPMKHAGSAAVLELLTEILGLARENSIQRLLGILIKTRDRRGEATSIIGGNALTLLQRLDADLRKRDFTFARTMFTSLRNTDLSGTVFRGAFFIHTAIDETTVLVDANFNAARFDRLNLLVSPGKRLNCKGMVLIGVDSLTAEQLLLFQQGGAVLDKKQLSDVGRVRRDNSARSAGSRQ